MITSDAFMLLSIINTKLRDFYSSLDILCEDMSEDRKQIEEALGKIGYKYSEKLNKFVQE